MSKENAIILILCLQLFNVIILSDVKKVPLIRKSMRTNNYYGFPCIGNNLATMFLKLYARRHQ